LTYVKTLAVGKSLHANQIAPSILQAPGHDPDGSSKALSSPRAALHFLQLPRHNARFHKAQAAYDLLDTQNAACLSC
jgi:hypothetical protein